MPTLLRAMLDHQGLTSGALNHLTTINPSFFILIKSSITPFRKGMGNSATAAYTFATFPLRALPLFAGFFLVLNGLKTSQTTVRHVIPQSLGHKDLR